MGSMTPVHILMFPAAILVGIIGGFLGAIFTMINISIVKLRARLISAARSIHLKRFIRMIEPIIIMVSLL